MFIIEKTIRKPALKMTFVYKIDRVIFFLQNGESCKRKINNSATEVSKSRDTLPFNVSNSFELEISIFGITESLQIKFKLLTNWYAQFSSIIMKKCYILLSVYYTKWINYFCSIFLYSTFWATPRIIFIDFFIENYVILSSFKQTP